MTSPRQVFKEHSVTYYYASRFLPREKRKHVENLYAFVRIPDEYVDNKRKQPQKFYEYKQAWEQKDSQRKIIKKFSETQEKTGIKQEWIHAFFDSMEKDLKNQAYETREELNEYIYGSAEVIGLMMCQILEIPPSLHKEAKGLGWFMQYVNMLRDLQEDVDNNLVYMPTEALKKYGIESLEKALRKERRKVCGLLQEESKMALQRYEEIKKGIHAIPYPLQIAIQTAADMYVWTAKELRKDPEGSLQAKKVPSKTKVYLTGAKNTAKCYRN